jgi:hypothetical protein
MAAELTKKQKIICGVVVGVVVVLILAFIVHMAGGGNNLGVSKISELAKDPKKMKEFLENKEMLKSLKIETEKLNKEIEAIGDPGEKERLQEALVVIQGAKEEAVATAGAGPISPESSSIATPAEAAKAKGWLPAFPEWFSRKK